MRKVIVLGALALLCSVLVAGAQAGRQAAVVKLKFATYVWQPTTVAANKAIVDSWNKSHPGIQVEIVPVDVNSVHDKLLTSFVGGTAADIIHDEAADIAGFTQQGYLANLTPLIPKTLKASIPKELWATVNFGGKITGVPALLQTYNVFANMTILKAAGIKAPTLNNPWTWATFRAIAKRLTNSSRFGVCWGLRSPMAAVQTMSLNYGGQFFYLENGKWTFKFGPNDQNVIKQMHDMIHVDKSVDPAATGLSGSAVLPGFFGGKCAMTVQGNFPAQGMIAQSPAGFNWAMFPLLKGQTQHQVANPQTLLDLAAEHEQAGGDVVHRVPGEQAEPGQARARRLADPGEPGGGQGGPQVDEAGRQLADRDRVGRPLPQGELGLAGRVSALEGGGGAAERSSST